MTRLLSLRPQVKPPHPRLPPQGQPRSSRSSLDLPLICLALSMQHPFRVLPFSPVDSVQIPQAEVLLHADCSGKVVTCEISPYFLQARQEATSEKAHWFISNMQVSKGGPSVSIVMKTLRDAEAGDVWHPTLKLPLSPEGTVKTKGEKTKCSVTRKVFLVCMCVCRDQRTTCRIYHVGSKGLNEFTRLGSKHLYPLSCHSNLETKTHIERQ